MSHSLRAPRFALAPSSYSSSSSFWPLRAALSGLCFFTLVACGPGAGGGDASPGDGAAGDASADSAAPRAPRCSATPPPCTDEQVSGLRLFGTTSPAMITAETAPMGEFISRVDARGGGMTPTQSFVYARFTPTGLEKVAISDEEAFGSLDWDVAFRRFVIRVNSGVGGPSCVEAGRATPGTEFAAVTSVPPTISYATEEYYTPRCMLVPDGSGIGSPGTVLSTFWTYTSCVEMSGYVYVVHLRDGRHVKLEVLSYYDPEAQQVCNSTGMAPTPNGAGNIRVRWSFLQ